jgi:hypothetical protein
MRGNGERYVAIYNKNMTIYEPKKATIYDPVTMFRFANWMVKASEWVGEQQIFKTPKKTNATNGKQTSKP